MREDRKRFQECGWLEKMWRYRFYVYIPFKYVWYMYIKLLVVRETELNEDSGYVEDTGNSYNPKGRNLWRLLIGIAQGDMNWTYTMEEVMERVKKRMKK